ncbi:MAG: NAD(+) synthase [Bacteroides sp.]|nr:NAD(+) synthase [Eubacterium sp.]MCM1419539.1 NAD(+) synthase [Roseburia sp.]MCM1463475.1 NAD(+) synthase [Bacteroides sp.]
MKDGFLKIGTATPPIRVADPRHNAERIIAAIRAAAAEGVKLLALPELGVTGYTCGDLFFQGALLNAAERALDEIAAATADLDLVAAVGVPLRENGKLYNCAVILSRGVILGVVPKRHIPNYNEFYEKRYFESGSSFAGKNGSRPTVFTCRALPEFSFGVELCEDLWSPCPPSGALALSGASVILNLSASNETVGKAEYRRALVTGQSARLLCAYAYASAGEGESTTDAVFGGHSLIAENGVLLAETELFRNKLLTADVDLGRLSFERRRNTSFTPDNEAETVWFDTEITETPLRRSFSKTPFVPSGKDDRDRRCETILAMQSEGLKKRLAHTAAKTAVVGISGGLDSCLALLVTARAIDALDRPRTDILAVTMPCFGTTSRTRGNAELLCERLGVTFREIPLARSVRDHLDDIGHDGRLDVTYENAQARERTQVLMDLANQTGGLVVGTGDLSELALGWATYNGDHMSMYGVNGSVPKTLVRYLVGYYAETAGDKALSDVLADILDTPVSPELLPADRDTITQKTEDLVGPYELHDFFLYYAIRWGYSPRKVYRAALLAFEGVHPREVILNWLKTFYRRFFSQQFKRSCMPDGPKVGSVTLSPRADLRMPSDASARLWLEELEALS